MYSKIKEIIGNFAIQGEVKTIDEHGSGNINRTFLFKTNIGKEYILQKINANVFRRPFVLMRNIEA